MRFYSLVMALNGKWMYNPQKKENARNAKTKAYFCARGKQTERTVSVPQTDLQP